MKSSVSRRTLIAGLAALAAPTPPASATIQTLVAAQSEQVAQRLPLLDLAAAGMKNAKTTGSIGAGSTTLTVADASGFNIGDALAVATGGEAGQGKRGTMGVGGGWPKLTVSSLTPGTTPPAANVCAYVSTPGPDYGKVLLANGTGTAWYPYDAGNVYLNALLPRALLATIKAKSGNTLTLSRPAVAAATNAMVVFDNSSIWAATAGQLNQAGQYTGTAHKNVVLPSLRDLFFSRPMDISYANWDGVAVYGGGVGVTGLCSVPGVSCAIFSVFEANDVEISGFDYTGNFGGMDGCMSGVIVGDERIATPTDLQASQPAYLGPAITLTLSKHITVREFKSKNWFWGVGLRNCNNCLIQPQPNPRERFTHVQEHPLPGYVQWWYQAANGSNNEFRNCWVDNVCAMASFEPFQEENTHFIDCGGKNVLTSFNSSGNCSFVRPRIWFTGNDAASYDAACNNAVMQNNSNVDNSQNINPPTVTFTIGSPGLVTLTDPIFREVGDIINFVTTGALPSGLTVGTRYYICAIVETAPIGQNTGVKSFRVSTNQPARDGMGGLPINFAGSQSGAHKVKLDFTRLTALSNTIYDPHIEITAPCNAVTGRSRTLINLGPTPTKVLPVDSASPKGYLRNVPMPRRSPHDPNFFKAIRGGSLGQVARGALIVADTSASGYTPPISTDSAEAGALEIVGCGFDFALSRSKINAHDNLSKAAWIAAHGNPA